MVYTFRVAADSQGATSLDVLACQRIEVAQPFSVFPVSIPGTACGGWVLSESPGGQRKQRLH